MTKRLYLDEDKLRQIGFDHAMIATFRKLSEFVALVNDVSAVDTDLTTLSAAFVIEQANIDAAEAAISDLEDGTTLDTRYVRQDQTSAWTDAAGTETRTALPAFAGQTITNPPTQAEVQAIDDQVKALTERVAALINDLRDVGALT